MTAYGGLDILHNNAAATVLAATKDLPVSAADPGVWDETMRVNLPWWPSRPRRPT